MDVVIRKLTVEVTTEAGDALVWQRRVEQWATGTLLEGLAAVIEQRGSPLDAVLESLDFSLEMSTVSDWQQHALAQVRERFEKAVAGMAEASRASPVPNAKRSSSHARDVLLWYLAHGSLPWHGSDECLRAEASRLAQLRDLQDLDGLVATVAQTPNAVLRLVRLLPEATLVSWWCARAGTSRVRLEGLARDVDSWCSRLGPVEEPTGFSRASGRTLPDSLWQALLCDATPHPGGTPQGIRADALHRWIRTLDLPAQSREDSRLGSALGALQTPELREALRARVGQPPRVDDVGAVADAAGAREKEAEICSDGVFLDHAGLVIVGPFLHRLFVQLGFARRSELQNVPAALATLHHLATGWVDTPVEHELLLAKVLCGLPLEAAPERLVAPTIEVRDEAHSLLCAVLEHWSSLGKTSVGGLREAFLQRPGKLSIDGQGNWHLRVEQRPYDMLLDTLPWGIQMTRLPWMKRLLITEWYG